MINYLYYKTNFKGGVFFEKKVLLELILALLLVPHAVAFAANESKGVKINGSISPQSFNYLARAQSLMFVNTNNTVIVLIIKEQWRLQILVRFLKLFSIIFDLKNACK